MQKTFLKVKEAASVYGVGRNCIYNAIHRGELRAYKPNGRDYLLKTSEIEAWIEKFVS